VVVDNKDFELMDHFGFLTIKENNIRGSTQGVFILSSTSPNHIYDTKGMGVYIHKEGIRESMAVFLVRTVVKSNWVIGNDVYVCRSK
jgi:hypothetical protein